MDRDSPLLCVLLAALPIALAAALTLLPCSRGLAFDPRVEEKVVEVKAGNDWVTTGLSVTPEDRVTITAEGEVCFSSSRRYDACVDPEGMSQAEYLRRFHGDAVACDDPYLSSNHAELIGMLENGYPYSFGIGAHKSFIGRRGTIMLRINDCTLGNNSGYFTVTIKVEYDVSD